MNYNTFCLGALIAAFILSSCGPSQRRTYQSDNAFTRCFDRDYNPEISLVQKKNCWSDWLMSRQYNQPDDKTSYAKLRLSEIADGVSIPGPPGPPGSFDSRPSLPPQSGPPQAGTPQGGTKSDESPPGTPPQDAGALETEHKAAVSEPASAICEETCRVSFHSCTKECPTENSQGEGSAPCQKACDAGYRGCMKSCFQ